MITHAIWYSTKSATFMYERNYDHRSMHIHEQPAAACQLNPHPMEEVGYVGECTYGAASAQYPPRVLVHLVHATHAAAPGSPRAFAVDIESSTVNCSDS